MKKIKAFVLAALLASASVPLSVIAHGGVSKLINNSIVYLNQTPLSPFVGERVTFAVSLTDLNQAPLRQLPVEVRVIDTFFGDATRDQVIRTEHFTTNPNGAFQFVHEFDKENYFDVEFFFDDPETGERNQIGFLVQPREKDLFNNTTVKIILGVVALDVLLFVWLLRRKI